MVNKTEKTCFPDSIETFLQIADFTKSFEIFVDKINTTMNVVSLIRNLLPRNCERLSFHGPYASEAEVEELLQVFSIVIHSVSVRIQDLKNAAISLCFFIF